MTQLETFPHLTADAANDTLHAVIPDHLCIGASADPFLYGGSGFAACIAAMERMTALPPIFATVQFVNKGHSGETINFTPDLISGGASIKQCRLSAHIGDRPFAFLVGAAGARAGLTPHQGQRAPLVPPPHDCAERSVARQVSSKLNTLFEFRLAAGQLPNRRDWSGDGGEDVAYWIRKRAGGAIVRIDLPVIADFASLALPSALGRPASGTSLDNMIRFANLPETPQTEWVLACFQVASAAHGLAHMNTQIYAESGTLLAVAGQTMLIREHPPT